MANGDTDQNPGEEDLERYDLYSKEEEQEIFAKMEELALAGQLDDDSYRALLADYGLTEDDFTPPENVGGMVDDGYDLGRTDPPPNNSSDSDPTNYSIYETGLTTEDGSTSKGGEGGSGSDSEGGGGQGGGGDPDPGGGSGGGSTSGGGGMMEFPVGSGNYIPEGMLEQAQKLIKEGVGIRNLNKALGLKSKNQNDVVGPVNMTDAERNGLIDEGLDPNFTGEFDGKRYVNGQLVSSDTSGDSSSSSATGGSATGGSATGGSATGGAGGSATGGEGGDASATGGQGGGGGEADADAKAEVGDIDVDAGDSSATVGDIAVDAGDIYSDVTSEGGQGGEGGAGGAGGTGGTVNVNFEGDDGFDPEAAEFFRPYLDAYTSSEPLAEGVTPKILPEATGSLGLVKEFAEGVDAINRGIGFNQAKTATDIYGQTISDVEDAQSSLFKSNVRQAEQFGDEIDSLMGLDFLQQRDSDQLGFGQAEAFGRSLGPLGTMLADRQRAERKAENLRLGSDLLARKQSIAKDLSGIQGSIYSQVAPNIGVDPGEVINIAGTDINNLLRERGTRQLADATRKSGQRDIFGQITGGLISKFL
jgi:hypothetical protein